MLLTVDASRLAKARNMGLFAPLKSAVLEKRIPAHLRTDEWAAFSLRARVIVYNKARIPPADVQNYTDLADLNQETMAQIGIVWPNQKTTGTHVNVSGGGILKYAPNKAAAQKFLEYLASDSAQRYFADATMNGRSSPR